MPGLIDSLQIHDLGHLRIVAALWGVDLLSAEFESALNELTAALLDAELVDEIVDTLPAGARSALTALVETDGKMPWAAFARQYGELRQAGPGRRDREHIFFNPSSAAEVLFYRALLARGFFDTPSGVQEFAYIPDDVLPLIHLKVGKEANPVDENEDTPPGRPATPKEYAQPLPPSDRLLDDATTLLAALRMGNPPPRTPISVEVVGEFLRAARIIDDGEPHLEAVKALLESPRDIAMEMLTRTWKESKTFNELRQIPTIVCEGEWQNVPDATRHKLLGFLSKIPKNHWWSLASFLHAIKEKHPDFQRIAGDYDAWFIKRRLDGVYLRGFAAWDEVEGALIRYLISGLLYWLGVVELATPMDKETITAFRIAPSVNSRTSLENGKLHVSSQGRISIPRLFPRAARYQIARFCEWEEEKLEEYRYRVSTTSLKKAVEQDLKINQLLKLLAKNSVAEIPPAFIKALKRWERNGTEARVETRTVLRVSRPEVLDELRKSRAGRFLGEILGPVVAVVKAGAHTKVLAALAELGLLAEDDSMAENGSPQKSTK